MQYKFMLLELEVKFVLSPEDKGTLKNELS